MITARWAFAFVALTCLVVSFFSGRHDGVWLLGLGAAVGFFWTLGVFSRSSWVGSGPPDQSVLDLRDRGIDP